MNSIIVKDDFTPHAQLIRETALALPVQEVEFKGHQYPGIIQDSEFEKLNQTALCAGVADLLGSTVRPRLSFLRLGLKDHKPEIYIHSDNAVGAQWAAVLYLNPPETCVGGTAFWTHKGLGWDHLPEPAEIQRQGHAWDQAFCDRLNEDGKHEDRWTLNSLVQMKWNRLVTYPGNLFHSRYPQHYASNALDAGRLVWVCFFDRG